MSLLDDVLGSNPAFASRADAEQLRRDLAVACRRQVAD